MGDTLTNHTMQAWLQPHFSTYLDDSGITLVFVSTDQPEDLSIEEEIETWQAEGLASWGFIDSLLEEEE
jgi:hypothetical protein